MKLSFVSLIGIFKDCAVHIMFGLRRMPRQYKAVHSIRKLKSLFLAMLLNVYSIICRSTKVKILFINRSISVAKPLKHVDFSSKETTFRRDGEVVRASVSQSVDLGFISLVESYQKTLKNGVHSFPTRRSAQKG